MPHSLHAELNPNDLYSANAVIPTCISSEASSSSASVASTFDLAAAAYQEQLQLGLTLSGESADYFVRGRVRVLNEALLRFGVSNPKRLLDFGCGVGNATRPLLQTIPDTEITGLDCSAESLALAKQTHASLNLKPETLRWVLADNPLAPSIFDAVYTSGVFHHIDPASRQLELARIHNWLQPGGVFALFENNPWNLGTRWVMSRIPFDRDAQCLSPIETRQRLCAVGFEVLETRYLFFFPRWLDVLRRFEPALNRVPLGAQYVVFARRPLQ